jgi:DNA-binding CsgD family transcriptional regulator
MGEGDKIGTLNAVGYGNQEIARLLGKDANTVNVTLSQRRKRTNTGGGRKKRE